MTLRRRKPRRDELARTVARILRQRENRALGRKDPKRLAYMIADEILADQQHPVRAPRTLAVALPVLALAASTPEHHHRHGCAKLFTVRMGQRAANAIYRGTRQVTRHELRVLGYIERCQRNPRAQWYVRWYDRHQAALNAQRRLVASVTPFQGTVGDWWAIPAKIVYCESGNGGYAPAQDLPPNGASASGYYQMTDPTWQEYGGGAYASEAYQASKGEQDVVAHRLWQADGSSPWAASQGCWG